MTIIDKPVRMPRSAFFVAWKLAELGDLPAAVDPDDSYSTAEFAKELTRRSLSRFTALRLATGDGRLTPEFRATLRLLAVPKREFYSWTAFGSHPEDNGAVFVATAGPDAVRLITDNRSIQLDPIRPRDVAASLVDTLPGCAPARIQQLRVPTAYLEGTHADPMSELSGVADEMRYLMRAERVAVHKLYAAIRDGDGDRVRSTPLTVYDLAHTGRVLAFTSDTNDGELEANMCAGSRTNLIDALNLTRDGLATAR
ncbi:ESX secretion-associated protein EspG [Amycolatopsis sp. NPDC047767]|uniref:ESX secretion-associated protein EspG n=1 Tax=Amycolatopsis sp. NPDC047767 TaxID=3156765 RepID=UPI0034532107